MQREVRPIKLLLYEQYCYFAQKKYSNISKSIHQNNYLSKNNNNNNNLRNYKRKTPVNFCLS